MRGEVIESNWGKVEVMHMPNGNQILKLLEEIFAVFLLAVISQIFADQVSRNIQPLLDSFGGLQAPRQQFIILLGGFSVIFVFIFWVGGIMLNSISVGPPREITLQPPAKFSWLELMLLLPIFRSPLRMAIASNILIILAIGFLMALHFASDFYSPYFFFVVVLLLLFNLLREYYSSYLAVREALDKAINQILTTLHKQVEKVFLRVTNQKQNGQKFIRCYIMIHNPDRYELSVRHSYGMADHWDKDLVVADSEGPQGKAFQQQRELFAEKEPESKWGLSEQALKKIPADLKWMWVFPLLTDGNRCLGVLAIDSNYPNPSPELVGEIYEIGKDIATGVSIIYQVNMTRLEHSTQRS